MSENLSLKKIKLTKELMEECLSRPESKHLKWFKAGKTIIVNNRMQKDYSYTLTFDAGKKLMDGGFDKNGVHIKYPEFKPKYSPQQMIRMGVFGGKYFNDQIFEFPREWYLSANGKFNTSKFSPEGSNPNCNYFKILSRQSLQEWHRKGWIHFVKGDQDNRGWFEWYCRYWIGRRIPEVDIVQVKRWKAFSRHYGQYVKNTKGKGKDKHPKRRQALLQWSYPCKD